MKITAILPYFGGKRNMADLITSKFGPHRAYWEPFCGSLAVLLAKLPVAMETANDLYGDVINLARIIRSQTLAPQLYKRLQSTLFHEDLHRECSDRLCSTDPKQGSGFDLDRAYDFFISSWMGRNGSSGTASFNQGFCVRYTKNGGHAATRFTSAVDSIPDWHNRLRNVTFLNRDAIEIIERIEDAPGTVIYCDPPYLVKGAKYIHDFEDADHLRLAAALQRFKFTRVVVSYYDHPSLAKLYPDWNQVDCARTKALVSSGMRDKEGTTVAPEVLLINEPPASNQLF